MDIDDRQEMYFFSLTACNVFPALNQTYVRTFYTKSFSASSISELAKNVIFFADGYVFKLLGPPYFFTLNVVNAVELDYEWNSSYPSQTALPFANLFSILPTKQLVMACNTSAQFTGATSLDNSNTSLSSSSKLTPQIRALANNTTAIPSSIKELTAAIYFNARNNVYVIEYTAPEHNFSQYLPDVREMVKSL